MLLAFIQVASAALTVGAAFVASTIVAKGTGAVLRWLIAREDARQAVTR